VTANLLRTDTAPPRFDSRTLSTVIAGAVAASYLVALAQLFLRHAWIVDAQGAPIFTDFLAIWSAGRLALHGAAIAAYDPHLQHAAEIASAGHPVHGFLGWPYPPLFFFAAAALASLPYAGAFIAWIALTLLLYALAIGMVARRPEGIVIALAAPWVLADLLVGQNGLLTAALIGFVLLNLDARPALAGLLLGLLTYKPQFGLLFPLALLAGGHWRALGWACASAVILTASSCAIFGADTLTAFLHAVPQTTQTLVIGGAVGWNKLQSIYGVMRWTGFSDPAGWALQASTIFVVAAAIAWLWSSDRPAALKAAGLAAATLLVTPYLFAYDMPILAVAIAFLYREEAFDRVERVVIAFAVLCFLALAFANIPAGPLAAAAVAMLVVRRAAIGGQFFFGSRGRISPSCTTEATSLPSRV
jgi:hypothetical protein